MTAPAEAVRRFPVFAGLSIEEAAALGTRLQAVTLDAAETLFRQGESGTTAYLIVAGMVDVRMSSGTGHERSSNRLGPGAVFGELALLTDAPRIATIVAESDTELLEIDRASFEEAIGRRDRWAVDLLLSVARQLAGRFSSVSRELFSLEAEMDDGLRERTSNVHELGRLRARLLAEWAF